MDEVRQLLWLILLLAICVLLARELRGLVPAEANGTRLEQTVYLPKCSGSWWISGQTSSEDGADVATLVCDDGDPDDEPNR